MEQSVNPTGISKVTKSTPFWYRRETVLFTVSIVNECVCVCVFVCVFVCEGVGLKEEGPGMIMYMYVCVGYHNYDVTQTTIPDS